MATWSFYGRSRELEELSRILSRRRWFFARISGRRRIGKTTLIQQALQTSGRRRVYYMQVPDSDPAGVISAAADFLETFHVDVERPTSLRELAGTIGDLARRGYVIALDEFQYFHRKALYEFTSHLQFEVDRLSADADHVPGGLIVLGSIHTEMVALLEDRSAPLFARITHDLAVDHLDVASILEILRTHSEPTPERLLFLWNLFEGVPKFYRDGFEEGVLGADRRAVLERMFFSSSSPLRHEADQWFLRELRGRYDLVLKYVARHPGCSHGDVEAHARSVQPGSADQVGAYIRVLRDRFQMIERLQPVFSKPRARNGRFYIRDNFLRSWLAALATSVAAINFRPLDELIDESDRRLMDAEGAGLERLVGALYEERSRKGLPGFPLTSRIQGFWDRQGTEIDLVAIHESDRRIRFGTCKRQASRLARHLPVFDGHVERFLGQFPVYRDWTVERVAITPRHDVGSRGAASDAGYLAEDLDTLTDGL